MFPNVDASGNDDGDDADRVVDDVGDGEQRLWQRDLLMQDSNT